MLTGKAHTLHFHGGRRSVRKKGQAKVKPYKAEYTALIVLLLLVPGKSIYILYVLATSILLLFVARTKTKLQARYINPRHPAAKYFTIVLGIVVFVIIGSTFRGYVLGEVNVRDYTEAFRWVPVVIIFAFMGCWRHLRLANFIDAACIYLLIDGFVSLLQYLSVDVFGIMGLVQAFYNRSYHIEGALQSSGRVLGLSQGPAQHGALLQALVTIAFLGIFYASGKRRLGAAVVTFVGLVIVLFTQSQTTFIATSGVISLMVFLIFAGGRGKERILAIGVAVAVLFIGMFVMREYAEDLGYLLTLFELGLERHSYTARVVQWKEMFRAAAETPLLMFIGWGKYYFGESSTTPHNEYLFFLLVYGLPVLMLYLFTVIRFMFFTGFGLLTGRRQEMLSVLLFYLFAGGLIRAWPTSFLLQTKIVIAISLILAGRFWQRRYRTQAIEDEVWASRHSIRGK